MKKIKDYTLTAISIPFLIAVLFCSCKEEIRPDAKMGILEAFDKAYGSKCPYEGGECPNVHKYLQDYQIQLHMDTVWIYDYDRLVGKFVNEVWDSKLDSIIMKDNL